MSSTVTEQAPKHKSASESTSWFAMSQKKSHETLKLLEAGCGTEVLRPERVRYWPHPACGTGCGRRGKTRRGRSSPQRSCRASHRRRPPRGRGSSFLSGRRSPGRTRPRGTARRKRGAGGYRRRRYWWRTWFEAIGLGVSRRWTRGGGEGRGRRAPATAASRRRRHTRAPHRPGGVPGG